MSIYCTFGIQGDWIQLQTRKYGTVLFNKQTGEVAASPGTASGQGEDTVPATPATLTTASRSKKIQKADHDRTTAHHQGTSGEDEEGADQEVETPQPALRKRKVSDLSGSHDLHTCSYISCRADFLLSMLCICTDVEIFSFI